MATPESLKERYDALKSCQGSYCALLDDVLRFFSPELQSLTEVGNGDPVRQPITSTGIVATNTLVSGLFSNTTTMAKGNIHDRNPAINEDPAMSEWYRKLSQETAHAIAGSDFSRKYRSFLAGYVPRGTGIMFVGYDSLDGKPVFRPYNPCDCAWEFDLDGNVIEFHRTYSATAAQLVEEFGLGCLPEAVYTAYNTGDKREFRMLHSVVRRSPDECEPGSVNPLLMRYADYHVCLDPNALIREGGSDEMRYLVSLFYHKDGEVTGRSPAMQAYQSAATLSRAMGDTYDALEFTAGPPLFLPDRDAVENCTIEPYAVNYYNPAKGAPWSLPTNSAGVQALGGVVQTCVEEINKLFFVDIFLALEQAKGNKTAYEVSQLVAERVQALAPVANSLTKFFSDLYTIVAKDLVRHRRIDAPPSQTADPVVVYTSRLDVRLAEVEADALLAATTRVAQFDQLVQQSDLLRATTNPLKAAISIFKAFNVPAEALVDDAEAERRLAEITQARSQAAQAQAKAQVVKPIDTQKAPEEGSLMASQAAGGLF